LAFGVLEVLAQELQIEVERVEVVLDFVDEAAGQFREGGVVVGDLWLRGGHDEHPRSHAPAWERTTCDAPASLDGNHRPDLLTFVRGTTRTRRRSVGSSACARGSVAKRVCAV